MTGAGPNGPAPGLRSFVQGSRVEDNRDATTTRAGRIRAGVTDLDVVVVGATAVDRRVGRRVDDQVTGDVSRGNRQPVQVDDVTLGQGRLPFVVVLCGPRSTELVAGEQVVAEPAV